MNVFTSMLCGSACLGGPLGLLQDVGLSTAALMSMVEVQCTGLNEY